MSRQQTRSSGDGAIDPSLAQKKRARHRLVGAICLCLLAALIVPLVLESEPRLADRELPMELAAPDRLADNHPAATGTEAPAAPAGDPAAAKSAVKTVIPPGAANDATTGVSRHEPRTPGAGEASRSEALKADALKSEAAKAEAGKTEAARGEAARAETAKGEAAKAEAARQQAARQEGKTTARPDASKPPAAPDRSGARSDEPDVLARLIDRTTHGSTAAGGNAAATGPAATAAAARRYLVQIGAYSNVQSARTVSDRVVQAGLRPYQETVKTAQGDWIRVRVGPFTSRQDAERAQQDLKRAGVTAAIIAL